MVTVTENNEFLISYSGLEDIIYIRHWMFQATKAICENEII